jgi:hypothetical protein
MQPYECFNIGGIEKDVDRVLSEKLRFSCVKIALVLRELCMLRIKQAIKGNHKQSSFYPSPIYEHKYGPNKLLVCL